MAGKREARQPAKKKGAPRKLRPKQEKFVAEYLKNGKNGTKAAIAAGYSESFASQQAYENLRKPYIQERIERARSNCDVTPEEILGTMAQHMRGDIADLLNDSGRFDYSLAKERGVTSQIRKLKIKDRDLYVDGKPAGLETTYELELYSAADAAKNLAGVFGLQQSPRDNQWDAAQRRADFHAEIDRLIAEGWSRKRAVEIVIQADPEARKWLPG